RAAATRAGRRSTGLLRQVDRRTAGGEPPGALTDRLDQEAEGHPAACPQVARDRHLAVVQLHDRADDLQPEAEPGPAPGPAVVAVAAGPDLRQPARLDADAGVDDRDLDRGTAPGDLDRDRAAVRRMADRVLDQVAERALQQRPVGRDRADAVQL